MNEKALIDVFQLCWDVIVKESSMHGFERANFNSEHCKITDTTDTNFEILENRLAYTYKYGCYNILFFEKCFLNFLNECSDFEAVFPRKKLKVCSLSNGPGFDIIGLLCALFKSNKPLRSFPILNTVNMYNSWLSLYGMLIDKAYEIISLKSTKFIPLKKENISLIQGDIFSTLSPEVKKCISNSNVLLMVKVFFSSKATVNKFARSLQKIFLLLKPGALIFFIGSENNMNNFSRRSFLSHYVKTIYGPQKVTLDNIVIDGNISNIIGQKPVDSGHAEFVVWQKRNASDIKALREDSEKNKKNKTLKSIKELSLLSNKKTLELGTATVDEDIVDSDNNCNSDSESELSYTSRVSKLSETSSIPIFLSQSDSIHSSDSVIPILDKFDLEHVNCSENKHHKHFQLCSDSISDLTNETLREFYAGSLGNGKSTVNDTKSLTSANYEGCFELMKNTSPQVVKNTPEESSLDLKYVVSTSTKFPSNIQHMSEENANESCCFRESGMQSMNKTTGQYSEMDHKSDTEITFQENTALPEQSDSLGNGMFTVNDTNSSTSANCEGCLDLMKNTCPQVVKNTPEESSLNLKYVVSTSTDTKFPSNIQHMSDENANESCCFRESGMQSMNKTTGQYSEMDHKSDTEITCQEDTALPEQSDSLGNSMFTVNDTNSSTSANCEGCSDLMKNTCPQVVKNTPEESSLNLKYVVSTSTDTKFPSNIQHMSDENANESCCFRESGMQSMNKTTGQHGEMDHKSDPEMTFQKNTALPEQSDSLGNGMSTVNDTKSLTSANYESCFELMKNTSPQVVKNTPEENSLNLKCVVSTSTDTKFPSNIQHMSDEHANDSCCFRESGMQSMNKTTGQHGEMDHKSDSEMTFQKNTALPEQSDSLGYDMFTVNDTNSSTSANYKGCFDLLKNTSPQIVKNTTEESNLNLKYVVSTFTDTKFPSNIQHMSDENVSESSFIRGNDVQSMNKITDQHSEMDHKSGTEITFQKNTTLPEQSDNLGNGMSTVNDTNSSTSANYESCFDLMKNTSPQVVKNTPEESSLNLKYVVSTSTDTIFSSNIDFISDENVNESSFIRGNDMQSMNKTTDQHSEMDHKSDPEITFQRNVSLPEQSSENLMQQKETIIQTLEANVQPSRENTRDVELGSLHSLVQKCENLVTALEKFTISIKSDIDSSKNDSNCNKLYSGHHCCCVKIIHVCCCHKIRNS